MARRICCPNIFCRSTNIVPVSTKTKFSVGRAVVGGTVGSLFNPLGTIIGAVSGINGKRGKTINGRIGMQVGVRGTFF